MIQRVVDVCQPLERLVVTIIVIVIVIVIFIIIIIIIIIINITSLNTVIVIITITKKLMLSGLTCCNYNLFGFVARSTGLNRNSWARSNCNNFFLIVKCPTKLYKLVLKKHKSTFQ